MKINWDCLIRTTHIPTLNFSVSEPVLEASYEAEGCLSGGF
jgi:hypothetical protein